MSAPGFLITGTGRCGTGYTAQILRESGLNVGHESWWGLGKQVPDLDGDVSWLGCFDSGYTGTVYAQIRNPLDCIPSLFATLDDHPWSLVRRQNVRHDGPPEVAAARIWLSYNTQAVARAVSWWRLEDIDAATFEAFGVDASDAIAQTTRTLNTRPGVAFAWPDHPVVDQCLALADELGYQVPDPRE